MNDIYGLEYRLSNRHKWRKSSVTKKTSFSATEIEQYRHVIADNNYVSRTTVQLRSIVNGRTL